MVGPAVGKEVAAKRFSKRLSWLRSSMFLTHWDVVCFNLRCCQAAITQMVHVAG